MRGLTDYSTEWVWLDIFRVWYVWVDEVFQRLYRGQRLWWRVNVHRDQALILVLLDTGLRTSELCALQVGNVDMHTGKVIVRPGRDGGAKGGKGRTVFLGQTARRAPWRYLVDQADGKEAGAPLFTDRYDHPLNKNSLRLAIARLGKNAGVKHCHPHRFRHTFAITYLRSGGDVFTLQSLLGHSTLDMVQHYARIAEIDVEQAHRRAVVPAYRQLGLTPVLVSLPAYFDASGKVGDLWGSVREKVFGQWHPTAADKKAFPRGLAQTIRSRCTAWLLDGYTELTPRKRGPLNQELV